MNLKKDEIDNACKDSKCKTFDKGMTLFLFYPSHFLDFEVTIIFARVERTTITQRPRRVSSSYGKRKPFKATKPKLSSSHRSIPRTSRFSESEIGKYRVRRMLGHKPARSLDHSVEMVKKEDKKSLSSFFHHKKKLNHHFLG